MKQWSLLIIWTATMRVVKMQFAVPMYAVNPAAMQVVMPAVVVQMQQSMTKTTTTTTTTTTPRSVAVAVHVPMPMPVPFGMPAYAPPSFCQAKPRMPNCPPCPPCLCAPSCTPSFFAYCSPCHQNCRCRSPDSAPLPMPPNPPIPFPGPAFPMPVPGPPPLVVVPFPPNIRPPKIKHKPSCCSDTSSDTTNDSGDTCSSDTCASSDSDYLLKRARKRKKSHRKRIRVLARRNMAQSSDSEVVKPVLTYVSQNGNVKFKTKISNAEAAQLLGERKFYKDKGKVETVQVIANEDSENRPQVVVVSRDADGPSQKQVVLRSGSSKHVLQKGKKEIVFRPPTNKKISNLSVSFQVTE